MKWPLVRAVFFGNGVGYYLDTEDSHLSGVDPACRAGSGLAPSEIPDPSE